MTTALFQLGSFRLHSGTESTWKIECDVLSSMDWETLAYIISQRVASFGSVEGVPFGGLHLAGYLRDYVTEGPLLICDDVYTTGASMELQRNNRDALGIVVFARNRVQQPWIRALFTLLTENE